MNTFKLSLINSDQAIQARTDLDDTQNKSLSSFLEKMKEQLVTGETALLEIEGQEETPLRFEITQAV